MIEREGGEVCKCTSVNIHGYVHVYVCINRCCWEEIEEPDGVGGGGLVGGGRRNNQRV